MRACMHPDYCAHMTMTRQSLTLYGSYGHMDLGRECKTSNNACNNNWLLQHSDILQAHMYDEMPCNWMNKANSERTIAFTIRLTFHEYFVLYTTNG